ncbi:hypothetical protein BV898_05435 [Hypsibius exemplaris]|uniref:Uncharacterized protein n=1 Tax=Hypsibius exemplaris TaxID=2072580 RepID=A0A1W0WZH0_HYPEX|nr:hypothetical protein BV898_05435 [Hypsibius exemplaris]
MVMSGSESSLCQTKLLKSVGFLPPPSNLPNCTTNQRAKSGRVIGIIRASPAILLLIGAFYLTYNQGALSCYQIFVTTPTDNHTNLLLLALVHLHYGATFLSGFLLFATTLGHDIWKIVEWYLFWNPGDASSSPYQLAVISVIPMICEPYSWPNVILYFCCSTVPFILSQQVYVCAMDLAGRARTVLVIMETEILRECQRWAELAHHPPSLDNLNEKIATWEYLHSQVLLVLRALNQFFGQIFLVAYLVDVMVRRLVHQ